MALGTHPNAYDEGFDAYFQGKHNPYRMGTPSAARFATGYSHARLQDKANEDFQAAIDTLIAR